jgi:hypothetical protein
MEKVTEEEAQSLLMTNEFNFNVLQALVNEACSKMRGDTVRVKEKYLLPDCPEWIKDMVKQGLCIKKS